MPASRPASEDRPNYRQVVVDQILAAMAKGERPWVRPWRDAQVSIQRPENPASGTQYRGMNAFWLMLCAGEKGYRDHRWLTFQQALTLGGAPRKGEKSASVEFWQIAKTFTQSQLDELERLMGGGPEQKSKMLSLLKMLNSTNPRRAVEMWETHGQGAAPTWLGKKTPAFIQKIHAVFNVEQCDGLILPALHRPTMDPIARNARVEQLVRNSGAVVVEGPGNSAAYSPSLDRIRMPERSQFITQDHRDATLLHELGHWTGHPSRLARTFGVVFGDEGYAKEELRAELASVLISSETGVMMDMDSHASYLNHWITILQNDHNELFRAANDAFAICDYVMQFDPGLEDTATEDEEDEGVLQLSFSF